MISIDYGQNGVEHYRDFGFGVLINIHRHMYGSVKDHQFKWHFHFDITFAFWYIELQIGKDWK